MATNQPGTKRNIRIRTKAQALPGKDGGHESIIVYVHGIGQSLPSDALKQEWDIALFGQDLKARSRMAYWADLIPGGASKSAKSTRRLHGNELSIDIDDLLSRAKVDSSNAEAKAFAAALLSGLGVEEVRARRGVSSKLVFSWLPREQRMKISRVFLENFVSETAAYFFKEGLREKIKSRLIDQLRIRPDQSVTIVAHSQGSVIAYEVLSTLTKGTASIDALVTIGSPLGIREVQDFLVPDTLKIPAVVSRWVNFADPLDLVSFDKVLSSDFYPQPPATTRIQDRTIINAATRQLIGFNPHSAVGYLAKEEVREVVTDAMRMDAVGRFVIARDVAEGLALDDSVRQPVLVEALEPGYPALGEARSEMVTVEDAERAASKQAHAGSPPPLRLEDRIASLAKQLEELVEDPTAADIDPLRRFVAARLTASELRAIGQRHKELRVYAVWRSSRKAKHTWRSLRPIKADAAQASFHADGRDITWAVLDTGIQGNHPHFKGVIQEVWDCTHSGAPVRIEPDKARDKDGHGTHVSGIIAGQRADGQGDQRGVAPAARLVVYKVLKDNGEGEDAWIIKALDHIALRNEQITDGLAIHGVNLSLGGPFDNTVYGCGFSPLCAELRRLWRSGVLVVVSSGNEGTMQVSTPGGEIEINAPMSIGDPANLEECIAVGSVHADKPHLYGISSFSSRGPTADGRAKPDLVAPGERISSCNAAFRSGNPASMYREESGTSMAAPHVSGLLAAFLSVRREFRGRPDEVKRVLLDACTDLGRDRYHQGHGMPNLMQMLLAV